MRTMTTTLFSVAAFVASLATLAVGGGVARADIAPPDSCSSPGQPCQNAGTGYNQAGTCVATTCTKQVRSSDGGLTPMTYSCNACQPSGAGGSSGTGTGGSGGTTATGTGGTTAAGTGGTTATGTGGTTATGTGGMGTGGAASHTSSGSSGCTVAGSAGGGDAPSLIALGLFGLALGSRRRKSV